MIVVMLLYKSIVSIDATRKSKTRAMICKRASKSPIKAYQNGSCYTLHVDLLNQIDILQYVPNCCHPHKFVPMWHSAKRFAPWCFILYGSHKYMCIISSDHLLTYPLLAYAPWERRNGKIAELYVEYIYSNGQKKGDVFITVIRPC